MQGKLSTDEGVVVTVPEEPPELGEQAAAALARIIEAAYGESLARAVAMERKTA